MALAEVKNPALAAQHASPTGTETVLLVEDEAAVRNLVGRVLSDLGYQVLSAANGLEALQQVQEHLGELHLLLTDVVLPRGMQGTDLARELTTMRPGLPVLFMSGYARDAMISAGRLDDEMTLVQKPFSPDAIARAVRNILDGVSAA
jgi:CheY-like chemotaxis protein